MKQHLALLLAALVLPAVIACGRSERPPVEPSPPTVAEAAVTTATAGAASREAAAPGPRRTALPHRDITRSTASAEIRINGPFSFGGVDGEMVRVRPVVGRSIEWQLERLEPVTVLGETAYFRMGAWITSVRAAGSRYTITKWDDEAVALLVPSREDGMWWELTLTRANGGSASRARLIETAESSSFPRVGG